MTEMTLLLAAALVVVVAVGYAHSLLYSGKVVLCRAWPKDIVIPRKQIISITQL